jgi:glycosyltransferase involved in cell wall biosynthesis
MNICLVRPLKDVYSETFIRAHIERLPTRVLILYGGSLPLYREDDTPLLPERALPWRLKRAVSRRVFRLPPGYFEQAELRRFLSINQVSTVLAEYGPTGLVVLPVCKESGIPLVVHFHGYDAYEHKTLQESGRRYPELFQHASAIVAVSRDMEQQLLLLGAPREKLHYNPYGVDVSLFQGADPEHSAAHFVAVGRFVDKKAPHLTLLAFQRVLEVVPEARLSMIGDGPLWEACKHLSKAWGLDGAVTFLGPLPPAEVAAVMRQSRAFVQHSVRTSYGDSEGTPVAVLEAGATGLPVVATRHAGIQDVVLDGVTGLLVDEGDVNGMAEYMIQLASDPALAVRLGCAARERIYTDFSMDKSIQKLWQIIEAVI